MEKLILGKLFSPFLRNYPSLIDEFLLDYIQQADTPEKQSNYFYGINSLKWAIMRLKDIDNDAIQHVLFGIILEYNLDLLDESEIQFKILKSYFLRKYRKELSQLPDIPDIKKFPLEYIDGYVIALNSTPHNLTSRIFRHTTADAIVFVNPDLLSAGIVLRINSQMNLLQGFKEYIKATVCTSEPGWKIVGNNNTIFINYGLENKTPTSHSVDSLLEIIKNYFEK